MGSGSHWRMLSMVGGGRDLAGVMVVLAGNWCTFTLFKSYAARVAVMLR